MSTAPTAGAHAAGGGPVTERGSAVYRACVDRNAVPPFQLALVERTRALLALRTNQRLGIAFDASREALERRSRDLELLVTTDAPAFVRLAQEHGLGERDLDALALIAAPHLDDTI